MEVTVRVMSYGQEIDRITGPLKMNGRQLAVIYRDQLWPVEGGCIHVEMDCSPSPTHRPDRAEWERLIARLVPEPLPERREECSELLRGLFKDNLPDGVVRALSSLAFIGLEQDARELLVDFLCEKYDSISLGRQLQAQLLCSGILSAVACSASAVHTFVASESDIIVGSIAEDESLQDWDWEVVDEIQTPETDDTALRAFASHIQGAIGTYQCLDKGAVIPSLAGPFDSPACNEESILLPPISAMSSEERVLVERTAKLGMVSLDLLRYFVDNPGDRAAHAELVLGYDLTDINKILSGALNHYLKKTQSGGWVCHPWVSGVLLVLDDAL